MRCKNAVIDGSKPLNICPGILGTKLRSGLGSRQARGYFDTMDAETSHARLGTGNTVKSLEIVWRAVRCLDVVHDNDARRFGW